MGVRWNQFETQAPELAEFITARLRLVRVVALATLRKDGSPRVSLVDVSQFEGGLYLSFAPDSVKLADLRRDQRCAVVTSLADITRPPDEGKLIGTVRFVDDRTHADRINDNHATAGGIAPAAIAGSPVAELLIEMASWQFGPGSGDWATLSWRHGEGVRRRRRTGLVGAVVDVDDFSSDRAR